MPNGLPSGDGAQTNDNSSQVTLRLDVGVAQWLAQHINEIPGLSQAATAGSGIVNGALDFGAQAGQSLFNTANDSLSFLNNITGGGPGGPGADAGYAPSGAGSGYADRGYSDSGYSSSGDAGPQRPYAEAGAPTRAERAFERGDHRFFRATESLQQAQNGIDALLNPNSSPADIRSYKHAIEHDLKGALHAMRAGRENFRNGGIAIGLRGQEGGPADDLTEGRQVLRHATQYTLEALRSIRRGNFDLAAFAISGADDQIRQGVALARNGVNNGFVDTTGYT